ncbi:cob(I)yrinic acid a,c-diamide adenosyltransferase [Mycobacterium tuberculosis]
MAVHTGEGKGKSTAAFGMALVRLEQLHADYLVHAVRGVA